VRRVERQLRALLKEHGVAWNRDMRLDDIIRIAGSKVEDQSRNGVRVLVTTFHDGTTHVDAACSCFGYDGRAHNSMSCSNRMAQGHAS
jgi:hypothetical protein